MPDPPTGRARPSAGNANPAEPPSPSERPGPSERPLADADESQLLDALATGERRAAELLVERSYGSVFASLVKMTGGDRELAADLTQETYRKAWTSLAGFDRRSRLSTWLYRIAYNTFLNHIRRPQALESAADLAEETLPDPRPGQDERMRQQEVRRHLRRAVLDLPDSLRFTVTARFWAELPVTQIAHLEDISGAAVRKRLKNALRNLRDHLGENTL